MGTEKRERQKANRQLKQEEQAKVDRRRHLTRRVLIGAGIFVALFVLVLVLALASGDDDDNDDPPPATSPAAVATTDAGTAATTDAG